MQRFIISSCLTLLINQAAFASVDIETVTVTAERQEKVSATGNATTISNIQDIHATHISEILSQSPSTWISRGNGQEHLTAIRSPVLTGGGGCGPFFMAEDNIALRAPAFCNVNQLFDANFEQAERIEVFRGPGTAFYGSSAMHGIINILSPNFTETRSTTITEEVENTHQYGRLLIDHRSNNLILQTNTAKDNGYKDDSGYDQQKLRLKMLNHGENWFLTHSLNLTNLEQETAGFVVGKNSYKDDSRKKENSDTNAYRDAQSLRFSSSLQYTLSDVSALTFTPYIRSNEMAFLMHFQPGTPLEENGHNSFGIQSAYAHTLSDTFNITTGIDIDYTKGYLKQTQEQAFSSLNFPIGKHYDYDVDILTTALFLQTDNRFLEKGLVTAGVRFENARYEYNNHLSDGKACLPAATNCRYSRPADDTLNFYNWSPKLSVSYEAWENNTFYTTLAEAYRAPETSELFRLEQNQQLANIDSEQMDSVELGLKGALFSRVTYQLSAYYMQKSNVIFKDSNRQNVDNQKTKHQGLEASINTLLTNQLLLSTQLSYGKHQYDSNVFLFGGNNSFIKNNIIDTAPRHLHNITLTWFATDAAQLDIEGVYVGKYYLDSDNLYSYEGHTLTNLRFKYTLPQQWQVGLGITNITNEDYADRADVTVKTFSSPTPEERYFIGEPRSFRASVSKTF